MLEWLQWMGLYILLLSMVLTPVCLLVLLASGITAVYYKLRYGQWDPEPGGLSKAWEQKEFKKYKEQREARAMGELSECEKDFEEGERILKAIQSGEFNA